MKNKKLLLLRRNNSSAPKLLPNQLLDKLSELDTPCLRESLPFGDGNVGEGQILGLPLTVGSLFLGAHSADTMRTKPEESKENAHIAHKVVAMCAHRAHTSRIPMATPNNSTTKGYAGNKKRTNLSIDGDLVDLAQKHFAATKYKTLTGFCEAKLRSEFRARAAKLRKAGFKLPESLFEK